MAAPVGADVPFFIFQEPGIGRGIGDQLTPYPEIPNYKVVLVYPKKNISTRQVYKNLNLALTKCEQKLNGLLFKNETFRADLHLCNDLEPVSIGLCPEIPSIKTSAESSRGGRFHDDGQRANRVRALFQWGCGPHGLWFAFRPQELAGVSFGLTDLSNTFFYFFNRFQANAKGRRQAVRHRILVPAFGGSNPPAPAINNFITKRMMVN